MNRHTIRRKNTQWNGTTPPPPNALCPLNDIGVGGVREYVGKKSPLITNDTTNRGGW